MYQQDQPLENTKQTHKNLKFVKPLTFDRQYEEINWLANKTSFYNKDRYVASTTFTLISVEINEAT
ncbi:hypothetical protein DERP_009571 [Dermatophagoides pteronyssinus]|uniref:Uncharacterized protein n=1 Tax=Dermatophagoides pteronyssinus TaxID=6956 RepID=A0ABQ8JAA2_DERPT|nr:hypothetical protein DERP_009571 [Dermatophagoides pteronyssinus]